jgi:hypothetical protein
MRTGVCRYGTLCRKEHPVAILGNVILLKHAYKVPLPSYAFDHDDALEVGRYHIMMP